MRHGVKGRKLGRTSSHREALFRNQLQSLMDNERIITTLPKAKELRPLAERVITRGKLDTVPARRWALRWLLRRELVKKLFDEIAPRFKDRAGGYTRVVKFGVRRGDAAPLSIIEFTGTSEKVSTKQPPKKKVARRDGGREGQRVAAAG